MNLLDLYIKVGAKDEASPAIDDISQNTISKLVGAAKAAGTALSSMWAVKKVYEFGKAAYDAYSEFEQLAGGVEKIFDEIDTDKVLKDANEAFLNLNMSANEYLAAINQTGATFAQTMGDEKGYETAKRGMQAISDYATGTGRDISELNQKYTLITRAAGQYQSIADQFSGILPQTSEDFLEQAKAAGYLKDEYQSLTDVPVAEYQEAVTSMLEKGVADLGLAGNTAKEALTTLSGSMLATQSAWQNLVAEFGKPDADIGARISDMFTALMGEGGEGGLLRNAVGEIGTIAKNIILGLGGAIGEGIAWLYENGPDLMSQAMDSLESAIGEGVTWLTENGPEILSQVGDTLATALTETLPETKTKFYEWVLSQVEELSSKGPELVDSISQALGDLIDGISTWLIENGPAINDAAGQMVMNIGQAFLDHGPDILVNVGKTLFAIFEAIGNAELDMLGAAIKLVGGLITGSAQKGEELRDWFASLPQKLLTALGDLGNLLWNAGSQIISGLLEGLQSKWQSVTSWFSGITNQIPTLKGPKQRDLHLLTKNGQWIMQSLNEGLVKGFLPVERTLQNVTDSIQGGINANVGVKALPASGGDAQIVALLASIRDNMDTQIYLDGKALVGGIAPRMNREMARL